jgi:hypothetical protein
VEYIYIYLSSKRYGWNLTLSIILSPSHTPTDLGVGGGSAGQPPVGLCFVAGYRRRGESGAAMSSSEKLASTVWRRMWERLNRSSKNTKNGDFQPENLSSIEGD